MWSRGVARRFRWSLSVADHFGATKASRSRGILVIGILSFPIRTGFEQSPGGFDVATADCARQEVLVVAIEAVGVSAVADKNADKLSSVPTDGVLHDLRHLFRDVPALGDLVAQFVGSKTTQRQTRAPDTTSSIN